MNKHNMKIQFKPLLRIGKVTGGTGGSLGSKSVNVGGSFDYINTPDYSKSQTGDSVLIVNTGAGSVIIGQAGYKTAGG